MTPGRRAALALAPVLAAVAAAVASPATAADVTVPFAVHRFDAFRIGHPEMVRFGRLDFVGGFEVDSSAPELGGLSGLVVDPGGGGLLSLSDDGLMLRATILRDDAGRPVGLADGRIRAMDVAGEGRLSKWEVDSESLDVTVRDGVPIAGISFEGEPRTMVAPVGADGFPGTLEKLPLPADARRVRNTKGFESLAFGPVGSPLEGRTVLIAERAPRDAVDDDRPGWILGGPEPLRFHLKAVGAYDATDAKFGPDGRLYVLERLYSLSAGVRARIRRIPMADLVDGAVVDGEVVFEASLADQIDNMEGLSVWRTSAGETRLSLISDNNRSFLQRTVYLEFRLAE